MGNYFVDTQGGCLGGGARLMGGLGARVGKNGIIFAIYVVTSLFTLEGGSSVGES